MKGSIGDDTAGESEHSLADLVIQYYSNDSDSGFCEPRNRILVAVVKGSGEEFVKLIIDAYEKEDDLVRKRNICRLLHEVISRTEDIFSHDQLVPFLMKCLPVTICTHYSIVGLKSLLQRHVKIGSITESSLLSIQQMYDLLLTYNISSMAQKPRIDFLWISHFMVDALKLLNLPLLDNMITRFVSCVSGEKDPRNLLVLFELIVKFGERGLNDEDAKSLASMYCNYYPIQFSPPKNDSIGIKPVELKERLLKVFKASKQFGKYSMEVMIDCLYSGYGSDEEYEEILTDTLRFFNDCAPIYGEECYSEHLDAFIEVIISEFFIKATTTTDEPEKTMIESFSHLNIDPISEDIECEEHCIHEAIKLGELYYEGWESVSSTLRVFGGILHLFMSTIDVESNKDSIIKLLKLLKEQLIADNNKANDANGHAGFFLDVLCGIERYHELLLEHVIAPLCNEITFKFTELKKGNLTESFLCNYLSLMLPVLTTTLFSKIVSKSHKEIPRKFSTPVIIGALCCVQLNSNKLFTRGLKLLTLAVASSKSSMIEHVINLCIKESKLFSKEPSSRSGADVRSYAETILTILKCHFTHCESLVAHIKEMAHCIVDAEDIEKVIGEYLHNDVDISREFAEIIATTLSKTQDPQVVQTICRMCCRCVHHVCEYPETKIVNTAHGLSLALIANRAVVEDVIREELPLDKALGYYKQLWELGQQGSLPVPTRRFLALIVPMYISMSLNDTGAKIAKLFCSDGYLFLLPLVLKDVDCDVINAVLEFGKDSVDIFELEAISWLIQRWYSHSFTSEGKTSEDIYEHANPSRHLNIDHIIDLLSGRSKFDIPYQERLCSLGLSPIILSYVIEGMDHRSMLAVDLSAYFACVKPSVLSSFICSNFPFQPEKLSQSLKSLGFDMKSMTCPIKGYKDLFFLDGTEIENVPTVQRIQYNFIVEHCRRKSSLDKIVATKLLQLFCGMKDDLHVNVALQALLLSLEDSEIATEHENLVKKLVRQFLKSWYNKSVHNNSRKAGEASILHGNSHYNDVPAYHHWLQEQFLFQSLLLIVRLLCHMERVSTPSFVKRHEFDYSGSTSHDNGIRTHTGAIFTLEGEEWKSLSDVAVSLSQCSSLPVCRILSILIAHYVVKSSPNTVSKEYAKSVVKRMYGCLGDGDQRVRTIALSCRHNWLRR
ncbi:DNA repair/transcription protein met18/mms19 domain containing protein [Babesia gibsoni]|uniref:MMS19 nucleotide excision repair protein n=1 Tax=Babesia gibsoni TaxID=33632 RepID=A0AAD8PE96_BABGI|nr:DNA repair/transcription protein met18/mms19 domain containing protein [Babesia gibsoni]